MCIFMSMLAGGGVGRGGEMPSWAMYEVTSGLQRPEKLDIWMCPFVHDMQAGGSPWGTSACRCVWKGGGEGGGVPQR